MRYARTLGKDCLGMTGKFHRSWGDFHSFKNPAALQFECFQMLALNGKCCVGDQLHPRGRICPTTYRLIGSVYREVEKREPWCRAATPVVDIGVFSPEEFSSETGHTGLPKAGMAVTRMLQEGRHQFDVVDSAADLAKYRLLVLPDDIPVGPQLAARLDAFLTRGGALIASHKAGLTPDGTRFALESFGITAKGDAPFCPDFIVPSDALGGGLDPTEYVMDLRALEVVPADAAQVVAWTHAPYFNRGGKYFCSHRHTPTAGRRGCPAAVRHGNVIYFAHPIFTTYQLWAPHWVKALFLDAVARLLPDPTLTVTGPSTVLATVNHQRAENRLVVHLLHYVPERRCDNIDVIEDVIPLHDLAVSLRTPQTAKQVRCVPQMNTLRFTQESGRVDFVVPTLIGHQMICVDLEE
jgi:hypothetical protein